MTLTLELTPEEETRLQTLAAHQGMDVTKFARLRLGLTKPGILDKTPFDVPIVAANAERKERIADLCPNSIWVSDDFDAPLPDEFWEGE